MRSGADDVRMTCRRCADNVCMCGRRADDVCHPPAEISNEVLLSCRPHVIRASSAHRPRVVCTSSATRFQPRNISSQRAESSSAKNKKSRGIMIRMYSHLRETFYRAVCRQKLATLPILFACAFAYIVTFQTPGNART